MSNRDQLANHAKFWKKLTKEIRALEVAREKHESKLLAAGPGKIGVLEVYRSGSQPMREAIEALLARAESVSSEAGLVRDALDLGEERKALLLAAHMLDGFTEARLALMALIASLPDDFGAES